MESPKITNSNMIDPLVKWDISLLDFNAFIFIKHYKYIHAISFKIPEG